MRNGIVVTHPDTKETYNLSQWAKITGRSPSSMSVRHKIYKDDIRKLLEPRTVKPWTKEEDDFLCLVSFAPNLDKKWKAKAENMGWHFRSKTALKNRKRFLQQSGYIPKNNPVDACAAGWLNMTQLANYLGVSYEVVKNFVANGCHGTKCENSNQVKIHLKNFVAWATKPEGAALVAKTVKSDELALSWLLVEIGHWFG